VSQNSPDGDRSPFLFSSYRVLIACFLFLISTGIRITSAKIPTAVWHVEFPGQDTLFREGLAQALSQALAEDTTLKVYDARRLGGGLLDSLFDQNPEPARSKLASSLPPKMELAIRVDCRTAEANIACGVEGRYLLQDIPSVRDTGIYLADAVVKPHLLGACMVRRWREARDGVKRTGLMPGPLVLKTPAMPGRLLRDVEILREGEIKAFPPGTTLETGDMPYPVVASGSRLEYVLYPNGIYTYPLAEVMQLEKGSLGVWQLRDTSSLISKLQRVALPDTSTKSTKMADGKESAVGALGPGLQDSSVLLTPACAIRGRPEALRVSHMRGETRLELVQGGISVLPLLSSQPAVLLPELNVGKTHGYELEIEKLGEAKAEAVSRDLAKWVGPKGGLSLSQLLPGILFSSQNTLPALRPEVQDFIGGELSNLGMRPAKLGLDDWNAAGSLPPLTPGKNEAGCYLCRPNHVGP